MSVTEWNPDSIRNAPPEKRPAQHHVEESYWSALLAQGEFAQSGTHGVLSNGTATLNGTSRLTIDEEWERAEQAYNNDESLELSVIGCNRGGLLVAWDNLRGFVPASQLVDFPIDIDEATRRGLLARYISHPLSLRIIEFEQDSNRLIFSERAARSSPGQRDRILKTLRVGQVTQGVVTNLCDFGAFIDLGGVEGLIHISELSWGRVSHPRDVLKSGQEVSVHIMNVDLNEERVALSLKRLQPDPWANVEHRYRVGQAVTGVITNVVDFGAFASVENGLEGLIHISELAEGQFLHPRNVLKEGETITARILNIDGQARRLGLTLRNRPLDDAE